MLPSAAKWKQQFNIELTLLTKDATKLEMVMMWHCESKNSKHQNGPWPSRYLHGLTRRQPWRSTVRIVVLLGNQKSSPQSSSSIRPILGFFRLFGWEDPIFFGIKVWETTPPKHPEKMGCWFGVRTIEASNKEPWYIIRPPSGWSHVVFPCWIEFRLTNGILNFFLKKAETPTKNQPYGWFHVFLIFADFQLCFLWRVPDFFDISWIYLLKIPKEKQHQITL